MLDKFGVLARLKPRGRRRIGSTDLTTHLGELVLPNPVIAASGTFGQSDELADVVDPADLGAITVKSLSVEPWAGNPPLRVAPTVGGMINSVGLQNPGVDEWCSSGLPALRDRGARVIASVWGHTVEDYGKAAARLAWVRSDLVALEVNVSCPNLHADSQMFAHDPAATAAVVETVVAQVGDLPVFAKLSPNTSEIVAVAERAVDAGAAGLTAINTVSAMAIDARTRRPKLGAGTGGLSGRAIRPVALRCVRLVSRALPSVPIIGTGGVASGEDAVEILLAGATAVGVGTATFEDPRATVHVRDELDEWCAIQGIPRVSDLVGALEEPV